MRTPGTTHVRPGVPAMFSLLATCLAVGTLVAQSPALAGTLVGAVAVMLLVLAGGWKMQVALLVVACTVNRFAFRVTDVDIRVDQILPVAILLGLLAATSLGRYTLPRVPGTTPLVLFLGAGVCSAVIAGQDTWPTIRFGAMLAAGMALWFLVAHLLADQSRREWATRLLVTVASGHGVLAIVLVAMHFLTGSSLGLQFGGPVPFLVYGTFYEANILGSFFAAALVLAVGAPALGTVRPVWRWLAILSIAGGLALTFTRGAWIAMAVGILVLVAGGWVRQGRRVIPFLVCVGIAVVIVALAFPGLARLLSARASATFDFSTGSGYGRLQVVGLALDQWKQEPWLGTGFGTFRDPTPGADATARGWIPNLTVWSLHDTGIVGSLFLALFLVLLFRTWSTRAARPHIAAVSTLIVAFQATPGIVLGYFWLFCGMVSAFALATDREARERAEPVPVSELGPVVSP